MLDDHARVVRTDQKRVCCTTHVCPHRPETRLLCFKYLVPFIHREWLPLRLQRDRSEPRLMIDTVAAGAAAAAGEASVAERAHNRRRFGTPLSATPTVPTWGFRQNTHHGDGDLFNALRQIWPAFEPGRREDVIPQLQHSLHTEFSAEHQPRPLHSIELHCTPGIFFAFKTTRQIG